MTTGWLAVSLMLVARAEAANYFISPLGSNSNNGTSSSTPWLTFAFAINSARATCGDTLWLGDGTFGDGTSTGKININGVKCTLGHELVIRAQNQRRSKIVDDGTGYALRIQNSSYLILDGLHARSTDNDYRADTSELGEVFSIERSSHIIVRNIIAQNPNRYGNNHTMVAFHSTDVLFEDNESYVFGRHCVSAGQSERIIVRRQYCNARGGMISGGFNPGGLQLGTAGAVFVMYPCKDCIVENSIADGTTHSMFLAGIDATFAASMLTSGNKILGSICYRCAYNNGVNAVSRYNPGANYSPQNTTMKDLAFIDQRSASPAIKLQDNINSVLDHITILADPSSPGAAGVNAFDSNTGATAAQNSVFMTNMVVSGLNGSAFSITGQNMWSGNEIVSNDNGTNFSPSLPSNWSNSSTADPQFGNCKGVWVPANSPLKGAGTGGSDIGATILYRYENGVLTNKPLWSSTGKFPCGAVIAGVNDAAAGPSCLTIHQRLNVNTNGCSFPAGYPSSTTPPPAFSFSLSNGGAKSVTRGAAITNTVTATLVSGTAQSTAFSVAGLPSGVTASFAASSCSPTCSTTLTLNASASAAVGVSTLTVTATGGGISRTTSFGLTVNAPPAAGAGPIAHWRLDENTGTTAADAAGGDNNGTLTNGPLWTAGRIGSALSFDGINDSVSVPDSPALDLTGALTLSAWVNPAITTTSYKTVMIKNYTYFLYASAPGCNGGILVGLSGTPARVACDTTPLAANTWTHVALTYDGAAVRLYRNGVLKSTAAATGGPAVTAGTLQLGASQYGEHFKGKLDEARVYNRALSAAEVLALVNAAPAAGSTDLNGDSVTNVTDVQMATNQAAGAVACTSGDVNKDGACNVSDVQLVINRALGL